MNKYSKEFYNELYNEFNNSNLNVNDFCKKKGIAPSTFYKNRNINNDNEFVDITNKIKINSDIKINLTNMEISVNESTNLNLLKNISKALR